MRKSDILSVKNLLYSYFFMHFKSQSFMSDDLSNADIPNTYSEIYDFICQNRARIVSDWNLLFGILKELDILLDSTRNLSELHKDTRIILETIKIMQDTLLKEFRNGLTFEKVLFMAEHDALDSFFEVAKASSQAISFLDHLAFEVKPKVHRSLKEKASFSVASGKQVVPDILDESIENKDSNLAIYELQEKVTFSGKIEFFHLICDRKSYSKTVANAFNLALALRQKLISLKMTNCTLYAVPYEPGFSELNHSVFEITPAQYRLFIHRLEKENQSNR